MLGLLAPQTGRLREAPLLAALETRETAKDRPHVKLSELERAAGTRLWTDVAELLAKAE